MHPDFQSLMKEATRLTQSGRLSEASGFIQRALCLGDNAARRSHAAGADEVLDGCVVEVDEERPRASRPSLVAPLPASAMHADPSAGPGKFEAASYMQGSHTLGYKLFVPPGAARGRSLPLVVMLHGCTQGPDDFAAGTGMNESAREQGFYVLYPEQSKSANPQRCWNWFKHNHQQRGRGEPGLIAGMVQQVMAAHGVDARRVYIAGLSSGGAMAAIVAGAYPEVFAAVGVHSGLPIGSASNVGEALGAMKGGASRQPPLVAQRSRAALQTAAAAARSVPTIVFHGDQDQTVHPRNGEQVIEALLAAQGPAGAARVERAVSANGRRYTRSVHVGGSGSAIAEHWLVHGAGHAWSGGQAEGSYTDAQGPDATREMLRFFFEHPHADPRAG